jgi:hypothetical protein
MTLHLAPEIEQRLRSLADSLGVSVEGYLQRVVEEKTASRIARMSPSEWANEFEAWADSFPEAPPIPDEALRRENLYPDRW